MLIDARTLPENTIIETEVCIVGAGAAGDTLAREFIGQPFRNAATIYAPSCFTAEAIRQHSGIGTAGDRQGAADICAGASQQEALDPGCNHGPAPLSPSPAAIL